MPWHASNQPSLKPANVAKTGVFQVQEFSLLVSGSSLKSDSWLFNIQLAGPQHASWLLMALAVSAAVSAVNGPPDTRFLVSGWWSSWYLILESPVCGLVAKIVNSTHLPGHHSKMLHPSALPPDHTPYIPVPFGPASCLPI